MANLLVAAVNPSRFGLLPIGSGGLEPLSGNSQDVEDQSTRRSTTPRDSEEFGQANPFGSKILTIVAIYGLGLTRLSLALKMDIRENTSSAP